MRVRRRAPRAPAGWPACRKLFSFSQPVFTRWLRACEQPAGATAEVEPTRALLAASLHSGHRRPRLEIHGALLMMPLVHVPFVDLF